MPRIGDNGVSDRTRFLEAVSRMVEDLGLPQPGVEDIEAARAGDDEAFRRIDETVGEPDTFLRGKDPGSLFRALDADPFSRQGPRIRRFHEKPDDKHWKPGRAIPQDWVRDKMTIIYELIKMGAGYDVAKHIAVKTVQASDLSEAIEQARMFLGRFNRIFNYLTGEQKLDEISAKFISFLVIRFAKNDDEVRDAVSFPVEMHLLRQRVLGYIKNERQRDDDLTAFIRGIVHIAGGVGAEREAADNYLEWYDQVSRSIDEDYSLGSRLVRSITKRIVEKLAFKSIDEGQIAEMVLLYVRQYAKIVKFIVRHDIPLAFARSVAERMMEGDASDFAIAPGGDPASPHLFSAGLVQDDEGVLDEAIAHRMAEHLPDFNTGRMRETFERVWNQVIYKMELEGITPQGGVVKVIAMLAVQVEDADAALLQADRYVANYKAVSNHLKTTFSEKLHLGDVMKKMKINQIALVACLEEDEAAATKRADRIVGYYREAKGYFEEDGYKGAPAEFMALSAAISSISREDMIHKTGLYKANYDAAKEALLKEGYDNDTAEAIASICCDGRNKEAVIEKALSSAGNYVAAENRLTASGYENAKDIALAICTVGVTRAAAIAAADKIIGDSEDDDPGTTEGGSGGKGGGPAGGLSSIGGHSGQAPTGGGGKKFDTKPLGKTVYEYNAPSVDWSGDPAISAWTGTATMSAEPQPPTDTVQVGTSVYLSPAAINPAAAPPPATSFMVR